MGYDFQVDPVGCSLTCSGNTWGSESRHSTSRQPAAGPGQLGQPSTSISSMHNSWQDSRLGLWGGFLQVQIFLSFRNRYSFPLGTEIPILQLQICLFVRYSYSYPSATDIPILQLQIFLSFKYKYSFPSASGIHPHSFILKVLISGITFWFKYPSLRVKLSLPSNIYIPHRHIQKLIKFC